MIQLILLMIVAMVSFAIIKDELSRTTRTRLLIVTVILTMIIGGICGTMITILSFIVLDLILKFVDVLLQ